MIRFLDMHFIIVQDGSIDRAEMLDYFSVNDKQKMSAIAVYKNKKYIGIITYESLLDHMESEQSINPMALHISKRFWEEARVFFDSHPEDILTILDKRTDQILGFAYDEGKYDQILHGLSSMETGQFVMPLKYQHVQQVVIVGLNELAWRCYLAFSRQGEYNICVVGKEWEWFGVESSSTEQSDYVKLYLYAGELQEKRGSSVVDNFKIIYEICRENEKIVYGRCIRELTDAGIDVCECYVPEMSECSFLTTSEEHVRGLDEYGLASDVEYEEYVIDILGEDTVVELRKVEGGRIKERKTIPIGETFGSVISEYNFNKRVYLFGPCIAAGWNLLEEDRLYTQIQYLVESYEYQVVAVIIPHYRFIEWEIFMKTIPIREKDILLVINNRKWFGTANVSAQLDLLPLYNMTNRESMFCGFTLHTGAKGNRLIAEEIMQKYLKKKFDEAIERKSNQYIQKGELVNQAVRGEINDYIEKIKKNTVGKTGAIVMNCNPFTNGHRYLIEYAASSMDWLYVFVVEEDKSLFKYQDRFQMVLQGTADLANVVVVPSGKWVLSYKTMPCYFEKEEKQDIEISAKYDLEIFARYIAPPLGIIKRFVGEEPLDKVTRQYNEQMKEILSLFDIGVEEVERLQLKGKIVSASEVRSCMRDGRWEELKTIVPNSTFKIIIEKYC